MNLATPDSDGDTRIYLDLSKPRLQFHATSDCTDFKFSWLHALVMDEVNNGKCCCMCLYHSPTPTFILHSFLSFYFKSLFKEVMVPNTFEYSAHEQLQLSKPLCNADTIPVYLLSDEEVNDLRTTNTIAHAFDKIATFCHVSTYNLLHALARYYNDYT